MTRANNSKLMDTTTIGVQWSCTHWLGFHPRSCSRIPTPATQNTGTAYSGNGSLSPRSRIHDCITFCMLRMMAMVRHAMVTRRTNVPCAQCLAMYAFSWRGSTKTPCQRVAYLPHEHDKAHNAKHTSAEHSHACGHHRPRRTRTNTHTRTHTLIHAHTRTALAHSPPHAQRRHSARPRWLRSRCGGTTRSGLHWSRCHLKGPGRWRSPHCLFGTGLVAAAAVERNARPPAPRAHSYRCCACVGAMSRA